MRFGPSQPCNPQMLLGTAAVATLLQSRCQGSCAKASENERWLKATFYSPSVNHFWVYHHSQCKRHSRVFHLVTSKCIHIKYKNIYRIFILDLFTFFLKIVKGVLSKIPSLTRVNASTLLSTIFPVLRPPALTTKLQFRTAVKDIFFKHASLYSGPQVSKVRPKQRFQFLQDDQFSIFLDSDIKNYLSKILVWINIFSYLSQ